MKAFFRTDNMRRNRPFFLAAAVIALFSLGTAAYCDLFRAGRDLEAISSSGKLRVILAYDPINYFIYKGTPMGYSYELAERFAKELGVQMEVVVVRDMNRQLPMLRNAEGDLIAHYLTITGSRSRKVSFSRPLAYTRQVLVQKNNGRNRLLSRPEELAGRKVYVREKSSYYARLTEIERELDIDISIVVVPGSLSTSELIKQVSDGRIDYTVADDNIASTHRVLYPGLDFTTALSGTQPLAWAVRKNSPHLLEALDRWIGQEKRKPDLQVIHDKYYQRQYLFRKHAVSAFYSKNAGGISPYDALIREYARKIDWDWRLLSSLVYEESQFSPRTESWAGAIGLMQIMPRTAAMFDITDLYDPAQNVRAGTAYIGYLEKEWEEIADRETRLKFILASYNVGPNHVRDAQMLARKYGRNPLLWEGHVERYLELKSQPKYYNDNVSKYGYCNGSMPVRYTRNILNRYTLYSQVIPR
jgi:membrane-bound lytic murein transglycosylase F